MNLSTFIDTEIKAQECLHVFDVCSGGLSWDIFKLDFNIMLNHVNLIIDLFYFFLNIIPYIFIIIIIITCNFLLFNSKSRSECI